MRFIEMFLEFLNSILDFQILGFSLYTYLITVALVVFVFVIIHKMIKTKE